MMVAVDLIGIQLDPFSPDGFLESLLAIVFWAILLVSAAVATFAAAVVAADRPAFLDRGSDRLRPTTHRPGTGRGCGPRPAVLDRLRPATHRPGAGRAAGPRQALPRAPMRRVPEGPRQRRHGSPRRPTALHRPPPMSRSGRPGTHRGRAQGDRLVHRRLAGPRPPANDALSVARTASSTTPPHGMRCIEARRASPSVTRVGTRCRWTTPTAETVEPGTSAPSRRELTDRFPRMQRSRHLRE